MSDYAVVDMGALESDILDSLEVHSGRFPCTDQVNRREALTKFLSLTQKYVDSEGLVKMQRERDTLQARVKELEKLISDHNTECDSMCDPLVCGYGMYKRRCPTCPKDWRIGE